MNLVAYIDKIGQSTAAKTLHGLRVESTYDSEVTPEEREQISAAIGRKFSLLNAATVGTPQPSFRTPTRIPVSMHAK